MQRNLGIAALIAIAGAAQGNVDHGRVELSFNPFNVNLFVGNGEFEVDSPDVGVFDFISTAEGSEGEDAFLVSEGTIITNAYEIREFSAGAESWVASSIDNNGGWRIQTFETGPVIDPVTGDPQGNGEDLPDQNISADANFAFGYFRHGEGFFSGAALPASTVANGPLVNIFSTEVELVRESEFASYDGSTAALIDIPTADVLPFIPLDGSATEKLRGRYVLQLPQFRNVHREGILISSSPSGESQVVFPVQAQNDNDSYIAPYFDNLDARKSMQMWVYDVNTSVGGDEADGVAWAYVPFGTTWTPSVGLRGVEPRLLPMGLVNGTSHIERMQGDVTFTTTRTDGDGISLAWTEAELKAEGLTPANATLIAVASGGSNQSQDNIFTYEPNAAGDGWRLQLRDGPTHDEDGLSPEFHAVHFVVLPDNSIITAATPEEVPSELTDFENTTVAATFTMESLIGGNGRGTATADEKAGFPAGLDIQLENGSTLFSIIADNRGDNVIGLDNMILSPLLGVTIPQLTELGRFGLDSGVAVDPNEGGADTRTYTDVIEFAVQNFENRLVTESLNTGDEFDGNFGLAHFPVATGFPQQPEVSTRVGTPVVAGEDELGYESDEGVLFARNSANNELTTAVEVTESGFNVRLFRPDLVPNVESFDPFTGINVQNGRLGWVFLPYATEGLVAGQIDANGSVANGTGNFTISQETIASDVINADLADSGVDAMFDGYRLVIPGVDSRTDGMLILQAIGNPEGPDGSVDGAFYFAYEAADDGSFSIVGINAADRDTEMDDNVLDIDADAPAPFMFAYIPFEDGLAAPTGPVGPTPCSAADFSAPFGTVDIADVVSFLQLFGASDPASDLAAPMGTYDIADVVAFLQIFGAGCPQ